MGVLPDRLADRGVVDDREQPGQVVGQHLVIQHLVAVVQLLQVHVLGQVAGLSLQLAARAPGLLLQGQVRGRQPPGQARRLAFSLRERHPAVEKRIIKDSRNAVLVLGHGVAPSCVHAQAPRGCLRLRMGATKPRWPARPPSSVG
ncbi:MAG TPA: hypothetical protein VMH35_06465 [Streptosporangiaceae bacterium]|nr:hypothetical protein [Streptosporangiaceae bacterium]